MTVKWIDLKTMLKYTLDTLSHTSLDLNVFGSFFKSGYIYIRYVPIRSKMVLSE